MDILVIFLAYISLVAILFGISIKFLDIISWLGSKLPPILETILFTVSLIVASVFIAVAIVTFIFNLN